LAHYFEGRLLRRPTIVEEGAEGKSVSAISQKSAGCRVSWWVFENPTNEISLRRDFCPTQGTGSGTLRRPEEL